MKLPALFTRAALLGLALSLIASVAARAEGSDKAVEKPVSPSALKKYDKDGDGKLNDEEKAAWKAAHEAEKKALLEKYDLNKDGKLDDAEKAAIKADKEKRKKEKHAE